MSSLLLRMAICCVKSSILLQIALIDFTQHSTASIIPLFLHHSVQYVKAVHTAAVSLDTSSVRSHPASAS